ncbi:MAG: hypothetical protein ACUVRD_05205 [Bacteroidia bacterium]
MKVLLGLTTILWAQQSGLLYEPPTLKLLFAQEAYVYNVEDPTLQKAIQEMISNLEEFIPARRSGNAIYLPMQRYRYIGYTRPSKKLKMKFSSKEKTFAYRLKEKGSRCIANLEQDKGLNLRIGKQTFLLKPIEIQNPSSTEPLEKEAFPSRKSQQVIIKIDGDQVEVISGDTVKSTFSDVLEMDFYKRLSPKLQAILEEALENAQSQIESAKSYIEKELKAFEMDEERITVEEDSLQIIILSPRMRKKVEHVPDTFEKSKRAILGHDFYLELHANWWQNVPSEMQNTFRGLGSTKFNVIYHPKIRLGNALHIAPGVGMAWRTFRFDKPVLLSYDAQRDSLSYATDSTANLFSRYKSRFQLTYLRLPLEIGGVWKRFLVSVFGYADVLLEGTYKNKRQSGNTYQLTLIKGGWGTDAFQYGVGMRIGYRGIGAFFSTTLSPLWRLRGGPSQTRLFQAGIFFFDPQPFPLRKRRIRWSTKG